MGTLEDWFDSVCTKYGFAGDAPGGPAVAALGALAIRALDSAGQPLPGVTIGVEGTSNQGVSKNDGRVLLEGVTAGDVTLDISYDADQACQTTQETVFATADMTMTHDVRLPITLAAVAAAAGASRTTLADSVGKGGKNDGADVALVQGWLNKWKIKAPTSGTYDSATEKAIHEFQKKVMGWKKTDGLISAGGKTEKGLKKKPIEYDGEAETPTEKKLGEFFKGFNGIAVRVNPGKEPAEYVDVVPPYHINDGDRKSNAIAERNKNSSVKALIDALPATARVGKADPDDIKTFLEKSIQKSLVKDKTARGLREYLAKYGVSTDCSGLVTQALNFLTDGNMEVEDGDALDPMNVGSGSLKGGTGKFTKVTKPSDFRAGDTMHVPGHIRILVDVDFDGDMCLFQTVESTPADDVVDTDLRDGKKWKGADGGTGDILWRYDDKGSLKGLKRSSDGGKTWKSNTGNVTYGRWKSMPAS